jgi:YVTN family beta-propeller protein
MMTSGLVRRLWTRLANPDRQPLIPMSRVLVLLLGFIASALLSSAADYRVVARYPVGGDASRWDYLQVDPATRFLYVAHSTKFEVLNADTGKKVGEIAPASRAHGVVIVPGLNRGFASSGNDNAVIMFDSSSLKMLATIKSTGKNPDAIQYDADDTKMVYVVNGSSGNVTVINPVTAAVTGTIALAEGKLEQICFDGRGRAFVNNEEKSQVQVFDTHTLKVIATWSAAPGEGGTGLDIDRVHHRLFSVCGNDKLVVFDSDSGRVIATPAVGEDADGVIYDAATGRIFTSNADQTMTVLHEDSPDKYSVLQTVKTGVGAKQLVLDPTTGRIFLPTGQFGPKPAPTAKVPHPLAPVIPGSFEILVIAQ